MCGPAQPDHAGSDLHPKPTCTLNNEARTNLHLMAYTSRVSCGERQREHIYPRDSTYLRNRCARQIKRSIR
ncbi:hypothetical protein MOX02_54150 [Methylobacterium oxalidis]|uniref:Uncharacterized protein n=1 Tax=Methylobacterium oxalidis TaxID=944322 RepID=A0A512JBP6_9HYPH|nr:hypothetical protein MOX02_54150 [Methylobacterium oxalidis]GLS64487.1 hypothetical protein GCM10007888_28680 [Methylobacterium oxalidis]